MKINRRTILLRKRKAVLFDLDGTLVDTTEFIYQAYEYTLSLHKLEIVTRKLLEPLMGRGLLETYQEIAPKGNTQNLMKTHVDFQEKNFHLVESFPNILKVIKKVKKLGLKVGIVTSRFKNTQDTLKAAGLNVDLFDVVITADQITNPKPHPEGVFLALKKLKIKSREAFLIGDTAADIQMGKNAGVRTIGVTYGFFGSSIKDCKPDFVIDHIEELLKII